MPRKSYSEEFKRDAVAMYENDAEVSMNQVAKDLGINRATLSSWVTTFGTGKKLQRASQEQQARALSAEEEIRRLKRENARLRQEREILQKAAKYFVEETHW